MVALALHVRSKGEAGKYPVTTTKERDALIFQASLYLSQALLARYLFKVRKT